MPRRACITGAADTPVGKLPEHTCMSLLSLAARGAIEDARLTALDIDGVLAAYSFTQPHLMLASLFCEYFGLQPQFATALQAGGATACTAIMTAAALVEANVCQNILIVTGDNRLTGLRSGEATAILSRWGIPNSSSHMVSAYRLPTPSWRNAICMSMASSLNTWPRSR
jgi:3-oxoacyl-[acyl-carrier-protein] synthase III